MSDEKPVDLEALEVEIANVTTYLPTETERKMLRAIAELRTARERRISGSGSFPSYLRLDLPPLRGIEGERR